MASYPCRIVFIRHGETDYNAEGRLQGQRDIPLNGKGRAQASAVGATLAKRMRPELDALDSAGAFYVSPLGRTRETAELARAAMGYAPKTYRLCEGLLELTFGSWEGLTWDQVEKRDPAGARAREADKWNFAPPGGESYQMLTERIAGWLAQREGDMFVVSHGGVARALMHHLGGVLPDTAANVTIYQGRALVFEPDGRFSWVG